MNAVKIKCRDLMVGDWAANRNGSPMQIVAVDEDNAYACEGSKERPCIFIQFILFTRTTRQLKQ